MMSLRHGNKPFGVHSLEPEQPLQMLKNVNAIKGNLTFTHCKAVHHICFAFAD